jgi:ABC-2 type transport system ATP-binding protein
MACQRIDQPFPPPMSTLNDPSGRPERPALLVSGLCKSFGAERAVDELSFSVQPGEILGLVGPNGAGKTTCLRSIVGVLPLQEGTVEICGHDLAGDEVSAKRALAWVPEDPQPFDTLTVEEHLEFTAHLFRCTDWREDAERLLTRFSLQEKRKALGGELSRGMRQKLAFCCAWISRPQVVLMDEPLSGLDPRGIRSARDAISDLATEGAAVILSSHLLELIEALADRLLIIDHGRCVFLGTLSEARESLSQQSASSLEEIFMAATGEGAAEDGEEWG